MRPDGVDPAPAGDFVEQLRRAGATRRVSPPADEATKRQWPLLWQWWTVDAYADQSPRALPEIVLKRVSGGYEATLRDHASRQQKKCVFLALDQLPDAMNAVLCDQTRPWTDYDSYLVPDPNKLKSPQPKKA